MIPFAFLGNLGWQEILLITFFALLLFGGKKLPGLAKDLGSGIREFRKSLFSAEEDMNQEVLQDKQETNSKTGRTSKKKA